MSDAQTWTGPRMRIIVSASLGLGDIRNPSVWYEVSSRHPRPIPVELGGGVETTVIHSSLFVAYLRHGLVGVDVPHNRWMFTAKHEAEMN